MNCFFSFRVFEETAYPNIDYIRQTVSRKNSFVKYDHQFWLILVDYLSPKALKISRLKSED